MLISQPLLPPPRRRVSRSWIYRIYEKHSEDPLKGKDMSVNRLKLTVFVLILCVLPLLPGPVRAGGPRGLIVATAASVSFALAEIAASFEEETGIGVTLSVGSTGTLAAQITHGAPFDLFFAASPRDMERLSRRGLLLEDSIEVYAGGTMALIVKEGSSANPSTLADLLAPEIKRIAIANPDHAPYGAAAVQALRSAGLFSALKGRLVYAENIRQALNFVKTGDAQAGIVALSVVVDPGGGGRQVSYSMIPEHLHGPVNQTVAIVGSSSEAAAAADFIRYVKGPGGRAVLKRYGYTRLQGE